MKSNVRIAALLLTVAFVLPISSMSTYADYQSNSTFAQWAASKSGIVQHIIGYIPCNDVCPESQDAKHHAADYVWDGIAGHYLCTCDECGQTFIATESDIRSAYNDYVGTLPMTGIDSSGGFLWYPTFADTVRGGFYPSQGYIDDVNFAYYFENGQVRGVRLDGLNIVGYVQDGPPVSLNSDSRGFSIVAEYTSGSRFQAGLRWIKFKVPVSGYYQRIESRCGEGVFYSTYQTLNLSGSYVVGSETYQAKDSIITDSSSTFGGIGDYYYTSWQAVNVSVYLPIYHVTPSSVFDGVDYTDNSRPASITGDYGIINQGGDLSVVHDQSIVNETDNSVYNPVTNETLSFDGWKYDYSTRTYTLSGGNNETTTVTYGDENITIQEGDTIYYVYYTVPQPEPPAHQHNYTDSVTTQPTCTMKGVKTYTCDVCGNSYTEAVPALGHEWEVKTQVQSEYNEQGEQTVQGYTIFKCSRCGEEKRSEDGIPPPSGGDDSGSGIGGKLGEFLGTIFGGLLAGAGALIGKILDALISLAQTIGEKLLALLEIVLTWFETIPQMFAGFLAFLSAIFQFLPSEVMLLLTFGLAAVVFIGIIKAIRR